MVTNEESPTPYHVKHGFVIMLDALGVRNLSIEESNDFLAGRDKLLEWFEQESRKYFDNLVTMMRFLERVVGDPSAIDPSSRAFPMPPSPPAYYTFGDTILITWEVPTVAEFMHMMALFMLMGKTFVQGLTLGLPLRGAMSCGAFIEASGTVLGPAIADAANWFDKADWLGLIATPHLGIILDLVIAAFSTPQDTSFWLVRNDVPIKDSDAVRNLWCPSWPYWYAVHTDLGSQRPKVLFHHHLAHFPVPWGAEQKYANTIAFFDRLYKGGQPSLDKIKEALIFDVRI